MLEFTCPHCSQLLNIPEQFIGSTGTCRKCGGTITIEQQTCMDSGGERPFAERPPTLIAVHCETTGPSARKCNIIELAAVKFTLDGRETDSFFSFAHPGHMIPPRVSEKNGITDDMVAGSPPSVEVIKQWCAWVGPNVLLFSNHAHFDAKFIAAAYLRDDLDPPQAHIIDLMDWAEMLDIPIKAYKLRVLLDHIGHRVKKASHRALETCHGEVAAAHYLIKKDAGSHLENDPLLGRIGGRHEAINAEQAWKILQEQSKTLEDMCGAGYYDKVKQESRRTRTQRSGMPIVEMAENDGLKHSSALYAERGRHITQMMFNA
ncbi:MAG: 3'-5' exonuclease, partial [Candidatus Hydrogenedentales bacterium]